MITESTLAEQHDRHGIVEQALAIDQDRQPPWGLQVLEERHDSDRIAGRDLRSKEQGRPPGERGQRPDHAAHDGRRENRTGPGQEKDGGEVLSHEPQVQLHRGGEHQSRKKEIQDGVGT